MASPVCRPSSTITSSGLTGIDPSAAANYQLQQRWRLEEHVKALQDERRKIDAFKRELPICMHFLTHAIKSSNEQLLVYGEPAQFSQKNEISGNDNEESDEGTSEKLVLDEIIPWQIKASDNPVKEQDAEENGAVMYVNEKLKVVDLSKPGSSESGNKDSGQQKAFAVNSTQESLLPEGRTYSSIPGLFMHSKQKIGGGAFVPFSRDKKAVLQSSKSGATKPEFAITSDHEASSLTRDTDSKKYNFGGGRLILESEKKKTDALMNPGATGLRGGASNTGHAVGQSQKKMRRCWSTDLHRCFVDALQELGGPQVATPKQIRELMNVDGITNDEVKSHLQKYRLHARVPSLAVRPAASRTPQIVVLGGLWLPPDYPAVASQQGSTYCNSTQRQDLCAPSIAQDFYCQVNSSMRYDQSQNEPAQREISLSQVHIQLPGQFSGGAPISSEASKEDIFEVA